MVSGDVFEGEYVSVSTKSLLSLYLSKYRFSTIIMRSCTSEQKTELSELRNAFRVIWSHGSHRVPDAKFYSLDLLRESYLNEPNILSEWNDQVPWIHGVSIC